MSCPEQKQSPKQKRFPLDPKDGRNPVEHIKKDEWYKYVRETLCATDLYDQYEFLDILHDNGSNQIIKIRDKKSNTYSIVKRYKTGNYFGKMEQIWREYILIHETMLLEYGEIYCDRKTRDFYIVQTSYCDSLREIITKNGPFIKENDVKLITADLLDKLWIIHNSQHVHCDLKPSNIVLRDSSKFVEEKDDIDDAVIDGYKIIDFELLRRNNSKGSYCGSMGWSAPEIQYTHSKKNKYTYSSDIFSLGLIILFLLFGTQPLEITHNQRILYIERLENHLNNNKQINLDINIHRRLHTIWYKNVVLKSENKIRNYLIKLYYDNKISLSLFELLHDGMLIYDPKKRWNCKQIYNSKWFNDIRIRDQNL